VRNIFCKIDMTYIKLFTMKNNWKLSF